MLSKSYFDYDLFVLESENGDMQYDIVDEGSISDAISSFVDRINKTIKRMSGHKEEKNLYSILTPKSTSGNPHKTFKMTMKTTNIDNRKILQQTQTAVKKALLLMHKRLNGAFNSSDSAAYDKITKLMDQADDQNTPLAFVFFDETFEDTIITKEVSVNDMCVLSNTAVQTCCDLYKLSTDAQKQNDQLSRKFENMERTIDYRNILEQERTLCTFAFWLIEGSLYLCGKCAEQSQNNAETIMKAYNKKHSKETGSIVIEYKDARQ